jgi:hypothetical protein
MKKLLILFSITSVVFGSCTKDRDFPVIINPNDTIAGPGSKDSIVEGTLRVNEFLARGGSFYNELVLPGNPNGGSDWIELFNTTNDTIVFEKNKWFITDTIGNNKKYQLPELTMLPRSFLVVWADGLDTVINQIHTNFNLSKDGEDIGLFYQSDSTLIKVDSYSFGTQQSGVSEGRLPDGGSTWTFFNTPTPGQPNQ